MPDPVLDVFNSDAFSMTTLTNAVNSMPFKPGLLGELGLYEEEGIPTLTFGIEEDSQTLALVQSKPWGGVPTPVSDNLRAVRDFRIRHLPLTASINPLEVQNLRGYAVAMTPSQVIASVEQLRDRKLKKMRDDLEVTLEYHRMGGLKGLLLDADGSTIYNFFTQFNVAQQTFNMVLSTSTTDVIIKIRAAIRLSLDALGNQQVSSWAGFCSDGFFDLLTAHADVKAHYLNWQAAATLSGQHRAYGVFNFGSVDWFNYRGQVGTTKFVEDDYAYLVPVGAPGLFVGKFGPSDYLDRVNQIPSPDGEKIEVRSEMLPMAKGLNMEAQSNPLYLCTKPRTIIKLHKHNG